MKKILITRKLIKDSEDKASKTFEPIFNSNDELYSQSKVIEMSNGCDGILTSLTDKMDKETINKISNDRLIQLKDLVMKYICNEYQSKSKDMIIAVRKFEETLAKHRRRGKGIYIYIYILYNNKF